MSNLYRSFEKEIFNSPHVSAIFPHSPFFWDDLNLDSDLDLWSKVIKNIMCSLELEFSICAKIEADPTSGLGEVRGMTDRQTELRYYNINTLSNIEFNKMF